MSEPETQQEWQDGSAEAAEYAAIQQRLTDPALERRYARLLADTGPADTSRAAAVDLVDGHARQLSQLAAAGVLFGPDCSQFQGVVDWSKVRAAGCLIGGYKVSEGRTFQDPQHQNNRRGVQVAGLVPVAYHYLYGSAEYVKNPGLWAAQADWYCKLVDPDAVHVLDVEAPLADPGLGVAAWVTAYRKHFPTHPLVIYTNRGMWVNRSHVTDRWPAGVGVWHAGYRDGLYISAKGTIAAQWAAISGVTNSAAGLGAPACQLWQITDHASVPGVAGLCDGNAFQGTLAQLQALAGAAPPPPKPPKPDDPPKPATVLTVRGPLAAGAKDTGTDRSVHTVQKIVAVAQDGIYGPNTVTHVKRWQATHGLPQDGVVGPRTAGTFPNVRYVAK